MTIVATIDFKKFDFSKLNIGHLKTLLNFYGVAHKSQNNKAELTTLLQNYLLKNPPNFIHSLLKTKATLNVEDPILGTLDDFPGLLPMVIKKKCVVTEIPPNIYNLLPDKILDGIYMERDTQKPPLSRAGLIEVLKTYDEIDPSFLKTITTMDLDILLETRTFETRDRISIFLLGACLDFDMTTMEDYSTEFIVQVLWLWRNIATPRRAEPLNKGGKFTPLSVATLYKKYVNQTSLPAQYKSFLFSLAHLATKLEGKLQTFVLQDNIFYPPLVSSKWVKTLMGIFSLERLNKLWSNYVRKYGPSLSLSTSSSLSTPVVDRLFILMHGFVFPMGDKNNTNTNNNTNNNVQTVERKIMYTQLEKYEKFQPMQKRAFHFLYGVERAYDPLFEIWQRRSTSTNLTTKANLKMEECIDNLMKCKMDDLSRSFGFYFPLLMSEEEKINYFVDNLIYYAKWIDRPQFSITKDNLSMMTDVELVGFVGVYVAFTNRPHLLQNMIEFLKGVNMFFIPSIGMLKRSTNQYTYVNRVSLHQQLTEPIFLVSFGNATKFFTYDLDDLLYAFKVADNKKIHFRLPEAPNLSFSREQIDNLLLLLQNFSVLSSADSMTCDELVIKIKMGLQMNKQMSPSDKITLDTFQRLSVKEKDQIRKIFIMLFETGMYMRRWKGPGNLYPLFDAESRDITVDPEENTLMSLSRLRAVLDTLPSTVNVFLGNLLTVNGTQLSMSEKIKDLIAEIGYEKEQKYCIRMASTTFIATGCYYLKEWFGESIPSFNLKNIMNIQ